MRRFRLFGSVLGLFFAVTLPSRADVVIGAFDGVPNCIPFGNCGYFGEYQQVYGGFAFAGLSQIISLSFASTIAAVPDPITLDMQIGLSTTTTADPNSMSTSYANNIGPDAATVFAGAVTFTPVGDNSFDLFLPISPFLFDPLLGNLLMDVMVFSASGDGLAFFAGTGDVTTARVVTDFITGEPTFEENGLVTTFGINDNPVLNPVPEPGALVLLLTVVAALGFGRMARRARAAA